MASSYTIEVAKQFGRGRLTFYDEGVFERLVRLYGSMTGLQGAER
jgi:hypothetical protein